MIHKFFKNLFKLLNFKKISKIKRLKQNRNKKKFKLETCTFKLIIKIQMELNRKIMLKKNKNSVMKENKIIKILLNRYKKIRLKAQQEIIKFRNRLILNISKNLQMKLKALF